MRRSWLLSALAAMVILGSFASAASANVTFCPPGSGPGQCNSPVGVAADTSSLEPSSGHVYVADMGNGRVDVFESDGTPLPPFGTGQLASPTWVAVDNEAASASRHDIYVSTDSGDFLVKKFKPTGEYVEADSFGEAGTGSCQFAANDPIAVGPGGDVYIANSYDKDGEGPLGNFVNRVLVFDSAGSCLEEHVLFEGGFERIRNFAVDSGGNSYVTVAGAGGVLRKYDPSGALLYELDKGTETEGVTADSAGNIFAKQRGTQLTKLQSNYFITEYGSTGTVLKRFGYGDIPANVPALAAYSSLDGDLYVSGGAAWITYVSLPPPGPVVAGEPCKVKAGGLGSVRASLQAEVNPEGKATTFFFEYVTQAQFNATGFAGASKSAEEPLPGVADFELHEAAGKVEGLTPETEYVCRVVAENADGVAIPDEKGSFKTKEGFEFGSAWVLKVGEESATVYAEGNPLGLAAKGQIEYVEDAKYKISEFAEALSAPTPELDFGATEEMQLRSVQLTGLKPGTLYHYRLRARNGNPSEGLVCPEQKPSPCPMNEHTFRTYLPEPAAPDGRGYELVSPGQKNSAEVAVPGIAGGVFEDRSIRIQAGADSGEAITYTSWTPFGDSKSGPATSQYLSKRLSAGWVTENMAPAALPLRILAPPFTGFSPDLSVAGFSASDPALTADCPEEYGNLYLRDNEGGQVTCLTNEVPRLPVGSPICFDYSGSSIDGSHVFFTASAPYAEAMEGQGFSLYEWSAADRKLHLVSILPGESTPVPPTKGTSFGAGGGNCQTGQKILRHAISSDGSKAFWTYVSDDTSKPSQLLVRINSSETIQLDAVQSGGGKPGEGVFWAASADGSVVYFTDENRLISGSKSALGEPDLYRYELGKPNPLTNLTKGAVAGDVRGVVGASDDGSFVYFVAGAVLSGEEMNEAGLKAQAGKDNLYIFHEDRISFIATLAPGDPNDAADWSEQPKDLSARVSPDGSHLAFLSVEAEGLAQYDNTIASGEHCRYEPVREILVGSPLCPQAFLYDAESGDLICASCNPSGSRPLGPTFLPGWTNVYEGPRYLSDNGSRMFFESLDVVTQTDESKTRDVYEFERPGVGTCSDSNPSFDPVSGGCHFLVSNGRSTDETFLVDASSDGRDVFLSTRSQLVPWADKNGNYDIYDYREGGGFPEPPSVQICGAESSCSPPPVTPPTPVTPATPIFTGPGNVKAKKPKPKPRKHKKHHKQKHRSKPKVAR